MDLPTLHITAQPIPSIEKIHKVTLLYNVVDRVEYGQKEDVLAEEDTLLTVKSVYDALQGVYDVDLFELNEDTIEKLFDVKTDLIFNLCYGIGAIPRTEAEVVKILERTNIPFTGASHEAISITTDKLTTKKRFLRNHIETPAFQIFVSPQDRVEKSLHFPLIAKPKNEDCSLGIQADSVVETPEQLRRKVAFILEKYKEPVLVEEYIEGRELNVTIVGNGSNTKILPISEIQFGSSFQKEKKWKIVDFEAKWILDSISYSETKGYCPISLSQTLTDLIEENALKAYNACHCRDYARIDLRLSNEGIPYFLEINLNPGIAPQDGAVRSAHAAGYTYKTFLQEIIRTASFRVCNTS